MRGSIGAFGSERIARGSLPLTRLAAARRATLSHRGRGKESQSQLGRGTRQQLPLVALLQPVHQDVKAVCHFLAVGHHLGRPVEAHDRGRANDLDGRILVRNRQEFRFAVGGVGNEGSLVLEEAAGMAVAQIVRA